MVMVRLLIVFVRSDESFMSCRMTLDRQGQARVKVGVGVGIGLALSLSFALGKGSILFQVYPPQPWLH